MLSDKQKRTALKKNIEHAHGMARHFRAEGVDGITLTHYAITSVKVVEKRVGEEVANSQAAMGGSLAGSASISGGVGSAIPSICM
jgi:hypothetical protein